LDWIQDVQTLDLLLNTAEERFSATLHEIERHLSGLGRLFREEARKLLDLRPVALTSAASATLQTDAGEPFKNSNAENRGPAPIPDYSRKQIPRRVLVRGHMRERRAPAATPCDMDWQPSISQMMGTPRRWSAWRGQSARTMSISAKVRGGTHHR
jgi:hypothetical protein